MLMVASSHGKVLREVILYGRDNRLDELKEYDEVHMHAQLSPSFQHGLYDLLHHFRMSEITPAFGLLFRIK
jgi:hypothetical protein